MQPKGGTHDRNHHRYNANDYIQIQDCVSAEFRIAFLTIKVGGQIILEKTLADAEIGEDSLAWAKKRIPGKVRIIEYTSSKTEQAKIKAYCLANGICIFLWP